MLIHLFKCHWFNVFSPLGKQRSHHAPMLCPESVQKTQKMLTVFQHVENIPVGYRVINVLCPAICAGRASLGNTVKQSRCWSRCADIGCRNNLQILVWGPFSICVSQVRVGIFLILTATGNPPECIGFFYTRVIQTHLAELYIMQGRFCVCLAIYF